MRALKSYLVIFLCGLHKSRTTHEKLGDQSTFCVNAGLPPFPAIPRDATRSGAMGVPDMAQTLRFGRRVPLPATVQILRDLLIMERDEKARLKAASEPAPDASPTRAPVEG